MIEISIQGGDGLLQREALEEWGSSGKLGGGSGLLVAQKRFWRIKGYPEIPHVMETLRP